MPGLVYEVPVSLGMWLISQGTAEEDVRSGVALADPLEHTSTVIAGGVTVSIADLADDCEPRPRRSDKDP